MLLGAVPATATAIVRVAAADVLTDVVGVVMPLVVNGLPSVSFLGGLHLLLLLLYAGS